MHNSTPFLTPNYATLSYQAYAPIFHVLTLLLVVLIAWRPAKMGRVLAGYMGLNYLILALAQTMATTAQYGFVLHTGGMVLYGLLGLVWMAVALRNELQISFRPLSWQHFLLLPLALLAFWVPHVFTGNAVRPNYDPLLLLTSPDYGLTFCLTTPIFLFLLILSYPQVNLLAYHITAFSGLLYRLLNLSHWSTPEFRWVGNLYLPLLILSIYALILPQITRKQATVAQPGQSRFILKLWDNQQEVLPVPSAARKKSSARQGRIHQPRHRCAHLSVVWADG